MPVTPSLPDRDRSLVEQIELSLRDPRASITDALRLCVLLSGHAKSASLRNWATKELDGYSRSDELPEYRKIGASLHIDIWRGPMKRTQRISPRALPEELHDSIGEEVLLRQPIKTVEGDAQKEELSYTFSDASIVAAMLTKKLQDMGELHGFEQIGEISWKVNPADVAGAVDRVRTALAVFVAELRSLMPEGQETPSSADTNNALEKAVPGAVNINAGQGAVVNYHNGGSGGITNTSTSGGPEPKSNRGWVVAAWVLGFIVTAVGTYAGLGQWLNWPNPWN
ncbi:hypothetical protein Ppa06_58330 [Planomonospora parontospora subsp. parontospora]|uniref:AbiTii domain-containing protein n=2 Tax=Planomonospora parontospora TaxID=58119 RepID=A0AA37BLT3_9ACTN|nr:hypothetical protein [Planomonospora parontospora]GGK90110.1 hypothetical protein GCM10010126_56980 [Planomonospora parontospora]GII12035.1 hypothetical protein Ppa06_58330 [Planomonospora parontospora subsp. parontospora]